MPPLQRLLFFESFSAGSVCGGQSVDCIRTISTVLVCEYSHVVGFVIKVSPHDAKLCSLDLHFTSVYKVAFQNGISCPAPCCPILAHRILQLSTMSANNTSAACEPTCYVITLCTGLSFLFEPLCVRTRESSSQRQSLNNR